MREAIHMWKLQVYQVGLDLQVVLKTTRGEATGSKSSLPHRCRRQYQYDIFSSLSPPPQTATPPSTRGTKSASTRRATARQT